MQFGRCSKGCQLDSFFNELKVSEIDLLQTYLEVCADLDIVEPDDPFWITLGVRLNGAQLDTAHGGWIEENS